MRYPNTRQELEDMIRRAFDVDRRLPRVGHKGIESPIWKLVMIPDDERSPEDVLEDLAESRMNITREDLALWETVSGWMRLIHGIRRAVVKKRCQGMGWKRIARYLVEHDYTDRHLHRSTLLRYFYDGLDDIVRRI